MVMMPHVRLRIASGFAMALCMATAWANDKSAIPIRFNGEIRPVLADACFACHGPDEQSRQAELRLDTADGLFARHNDKVTVVPGQLEASELFRRITSDDPAVRMPPPDATRQLSPAEIELLRRWIEQGARWEGHWSFQPLKRPTLPHVSQPEWLRNPDDAFILARLDANTLPPSNDASPETLLRRVTLDLTGLPPTREEIDSYLADPSPNRYERLVDRLLASPAYGEHMAVAWLDAARYADSSGYQSDGHRDMSRWRDWLIGALNAGMPFDQFTIEQLAGDMLPNPTLDQLIATGFHRNHRANSEGGSIPEEFLVEYAVDRVDTTSTIWLGLTIGCARCHDHKYDPISQRDYYRLFAFFNQVPEKGRVWKEGNSPPYMVTPTPAQQRELQRLEEHLTAAENHWQRQTASRDRVQREWEQSLLQDVSPTPVDGTITDDLIAWFPLADRLDPTYQQGHHRTETEIDLNSTAGKLPMKAAMSVPTLSTGQADFINTERPGLRLTKGQFIDAGDVANFGYFDTFSVALWIKPRGDMTGGLITRTSDDSDRVGWAVHLENGYVQVHLTNRWLDDALRVQARAALHKEQWQHVVMTYDGSRLAKGVRIFIDGTLQETEVLLDSLNQTMVNKEPLRIGSTGKTRSLTGDFADVRIYQSPLSDDEAMAVSVSTPMAQLVAIPPEQRTVPQATKVREYFLRVAGPQTVRDAYAALRGLRENYRRFLKSLPTTMIMQDAAEMRPTFVLKRGAYDAPTLAVTAGIPDALTIPSKPSCNNRLELARWLIDVENPLTARVAVNREWQRFFGTGIVATSEDFGTQGTRPSHPDLLDWLATEFIRSGWDVKGLHRSMVTSATYRQTSIASPEKMAADPGNRWLSRGPRFRMTAEMIRDGALAASGLLQRQIGGPSVKPYQPAGLWSEIASVKEYARSSGPDLYRRSLYSFVKRTVVNPTMGVFDATTRETCSVRRSRTNTPLQALTLMNDVTFMEAARVLAQHTLQETGDSPSQRIQSMFMKLVGRTASIDELRILTDAVEQHRQYFADHLDAAQRLLRVGEAPVDARLSPIELAAYTSVANVILNFDETVTKE